LGKEDSSEGNEHRGKEEEARVESMIMASTGSKKRARASQTAVARKKISQVLPAARESTGRDQI